ncbi:MAG: SNF2-related protein [Firmicutes bacterium]|nr:SNF2-related protein [Bacillota bacterium]MCL1953569.1 SNF2-related protein [Bacillota bacterium]
MSDIIIDNKTSLLGDDLKVELKSGSKIKIAASCFTLFAFNELKTELNNIEELQFIFTNPTFTNSDFVVDRTKQEQRQFHIPKSQRENALFGTEFEIKLRNKMSLKAIAKEFGEWVKTKVKFKSNTTDMPMQSFIAIQQVDDRSVSYFPTPQEFSASGLGYQKSGEMFTGIFKSEHQASFWLNTFNSIFDDNNKMQYVTEQIIDSISQAYKENSPEFLYYIILYNIFNEFLDDLNEDNMPNEMTGFKDTVLWRMLFDFQKDGVISIINKLEKHNGCILADSVGLGKTFTALAVMLYYSLRNKSVLVLCPKRLGENWTQYMGNDIANPFFNDRLHYEVLYHTDLGRVGTSHTGKNLSTVNWGNYDLVVIDESHNFRNSGQATSGKMTRYDFLINEIIKKGVKTKVLMLSATPVNNRYNDLKNQLALAYAQDYNKFEQSLDIQSKVDIVFRNAQAVFNEWSKKPASDRNNKDLINKLSIDFKILLDSVTIARSRKSITKYYNVNNIGKFPDRLQPDNHTPPLTELTDFPTYKDIYKSITGLSLSVYALFDFILPSQIAKYERAFSSDFKKSTLTLSRQNKGIKKLMTVNLFKRLESSIEAFRTTIRNMLNKNIDEISKLDEFDNDKSIEHFTSSKQLVDYANIDSDEDELSYFRGKEIKIDYRDIDRVSLKASMNQDVDILRELLQELDKITPDLDSKLKRLKEIIDKKINNPINCIAKEIESTHKNTIQSQIANIPNQKVLIFSAFSDTTQYLYQHLSKYILDKYNLHTAMIEGTQNLCTIKNCAKDTNSLLAMFSPISKDRKTRFASRVNIQNEKNQYRDSMIDVDILIATDCISEGQNLQDCDTCINYDIHWNPVRIVQRFGRIDRLGSINTKVQLINFWPPISLNEYINLTDRVKSRMTILDHTATGDDNLLDPDSVVDDYRDIQLQKLQQGNNLDLEDSNNGVSITDLGLTEFRLDAIDLKNKYGEPYKVPKGMHTVVPKDEAKGIVSGIVFLLRNINTEIQIKSQNLLHPYYLIYLDDKGNAINTHLQVKEILDILRHICKGQDKPIAQVYKRFNEQTNDGLKMDKYNKLLTDSVATIIDVKQENQLASFLQGNSDVFLNQDKINGLEDFELVAFVVVK